MKGGRPKPTARRRLEGNPSKAAYNLLEPIPPPLIAPPVDAAAAAEPIPVELSGDDVAAAEWQRLAPMLRRVQAISEADRGALVAMCLEWSRYLAATRALRQKGMISKAPSGYPIVSPYLGIATRALHGFTKLAAELGLTPTSRSRVQVVAGTTGSGDAFAEFDAPPDAAPAPDAASH